MPYFEQANILFIHIPKTGGTSIEEYFSKKYHIVLNHNHIYYRYNQQTIQTEIESARKSWKHKIDRMIEIEKQKCTNLKQNVGIISSTPNIKAAALKKTNWDEIKQNMSDFQYFKKVRLVRDIRHSMQHMTWLEICTHCNILWPHGSAVTNYLSNNSNSYAEANCNRPVGGSLQAPCSNTPLRIFAIVRNPYDRVVSDLFFHKLLTSLHVIEPNIVYEQLKKYLNTPDTFDNHKTPQYEFVVDADGKLLPNIHVMNTESLTRDMHNYGFRDFNLHRNITNVKLPIASTKYASLLNSQSIDLINSYYRRDFEFFGYKMLRSASSMIHSIFDKYPQADPQNAFIQEEPAVIIPEEPKVIIPEEPAVIIQEEPAAIIQEEPAVIIQEEPAVIIQEEPAVIIQEEPAVIIQEEPAVIIQEEPAVIIQEEPAVIIPEEPAVIIPEEPAVIIQEEPAVIIQEEPAVIIQEEPAVIIQEEPKVIIQEEPKVIIPEEPAVIIQEEPKVIIQEEPKVIIPEEPAVIIQEEPKVIIPEEPAVIIPEEPAVIIQEESNQQKDIQSHAYPNRTNHIRPVFYQNTFGTVNALSNSSEDMLRAFASMYTGIPVTRLNNTIPAKIAANQISL